MSQMERHQGIIKRISTKDNIKVVYDKLVANKLIDGKWTEFDKDGNPAYIDSDKYDIIDGCLFDVSGAPADYDSDEEVEEVVKLNDTDYCVHLYYYNGGGDMSEILDRAIPEADKLYDGQNEVFYAIRRNAGDFVTGAGNSYLKTPRLYFTEENAKNAVERHWPGIVSKGYKIVKLAVINE